MKEEWKAFGAWLLIASMLTAAITIMVNSSQKAEAYSPFTLRAYEDGYLESYITAADVEARARYWNKFADQHHLEQISNAEAAFLTDKEIIQMVFTVKAHRLADIEIKEVDHE